MGCCCSRPVDDDEVAKADLTKTKDGGYGTISVPDDSVHETPFKDPLEKTKDDNVISKSETLPSTPTRKEHSKLIRSATPTTEKSPLLETPPTRFGKKGISPKSSPKGSPRASPKGTPKGSPKGTPKGSPKASPKASSKSSPVKNGAAVKHKVVKPSSKDYKTLDDAQSPPENRQSDRTHDDAHESPPLSPSKLTLLELAKKVSDKSQGDLQDQETNTAIAGGDSEPESSSDEEKLLATFDNNPVCNSSGDELSPRVVKTEPPPSSASLGLKGYSKTDEQNLSSSSLSKKTSKAKDAMKKTGKNVKKMFKFGGKKKETTEKKTKKTVDKTNKKDDKAKGVASKTKSNVTFSSSTKSQVTATQSLPATEEPTNPTIHSGETWTPPTSRSIAGKSRMSDRMQSTYARDRMKSYEAKKEKEGVRKTQSVGFVDPRKAANERGEKLGELEDVTENLRESSAGFAEMARQLRLKSEKGGKS